ncbi:hypothetical protein [Streptomyces sp. NPDC005970]|uniref:hypothetical protein n=1 Tax=Streptomyces sp. NPDC005970 TaxID=3156723 RepID=UPI0033ED606F
MPSTIFRPGTGRRRKPAQHIRPTRPSAAGLVLATTAVVLSGGHTVRATATTPPVRASQGDDEPEAPAPVSGPHNGLVVIDNSSADSWLEVDRTLNTLLMSHGTAGSDHDGGGGAVEVRTGDITGPDPVPEIGHPPWQGESGD